MVNKNVFSEDEYVHWPRYEGKLDNGLAWCGELTVLGREIARTPQDVTCEPCRNAKATHEAILVEKSARRL